MKKTARNFSLTVAASAILFFAFLAVMMFAVAFVATIATLAVCAGIIGVFKNQRVKQFNAERKAAMEAAEALSCSLEFYEKELPLSYYSRFQFGRALDNAHRVGLSLRDWITLVHQHLDRNSNLNNGLQLKDVPAFVDDVSRQVREAYVYISEGSKGEAPKILDIFWFDESAVCGNEVRLFPMTLRDHSCRTHVDLASAQLPNLAHSEAPVTITKEDDIVREQLVVNAETAPLQMLTYSPATSTDGVYQADELEKRRQKRNQHRVRDVVKSEVLVFDTNKRKAKH